MASHFGSMCLVLIDTSGEFSGIAEFSMDDANTFTCYDFSSPTLAPSISTPSNTPTASFPSQGPVGPPTAGPTPSPVFGDSDCAHSSDWGSLCNAVDTLEDCHIKISETLTYGDVCCKCPAGGFLMLRPGRSEFIVSDIKLDKDWTLSVTYCTLPTILELLCFCFIFQSGFFHELMFGFLKC